MGLTAEDLEGEPVKFPMASGANVEAPFDVALLGVAACLTFGDVICAGRWEGLMGPDDDDAGCECAGGLRGLLLL